MQELRDLEDAYSQFMADPAFRAELASCTPP